MDLKKVKDAYCYGCDDVLCYDTRSPKTKCFDRYVKLRQTLAQEDQAKALDAIAETLDNLFSIGEGRAAIEKGEKGIPVSEVFDKIREEEPSK